VAEFCAATGGLPSLATTAGRGATGDQLNLTNVVRFTVGLAVSHTTVGAGPQE